MRAVGEASRAEERKKGERGGGGRERERGKAEV